MKNIDNKTFIIIGVAIAIIIGALAVFFASSDPDGLESTALMVQGEKTLTGPSPAEGDPEAIGTGVSVYSSPFPDYSLGEQMGPIGGIIATILGILVTLAVVIGATRVIAMRKA
ncbi:MAG TPA: PDGLE domain-containing protein [Methanospirillum sp.]|nr:PDGLE domain-containing protein [Methanospirillum sp.]